MGEILNLPDLGKGINPDLLSGDLPPGVWTSCANFRFHKGYAVKWEGVTQITNGGSSTVPYRFVMPYTTPVSSGSSMTTKYMIGAGVARVFSNDGSAESEITRYTEGVSITSITRVGTTATLTTGSNHGRTTGDTVSVWGADPDEYNGTFVITVTTPATFTYTMTADPGASADPVGLYSYNGSTQNFTGTTLDQWTGCVLGGVAYLNNPVDGLYFWNGTGRLKKVPGAYRAFATRAFGTKLIQIGITDGSTPKPWNVAWSGDVEPGAIAGPFTAAATNEAGYQPLADTAGALIDGAPLGNVFVLYKSDSIYTMQEIDGPAVFDIQSVSGGDGIFGRNCVVDTPVGHVFFSQKRDTRVFDGQQSRSIADGRVKEFVAAIMDKAKDHCVFLCKNPGKTEVLVCFAQTGHTTSEEGASVAYVWNWEHNTWGQFQAAGYSTSYITHAAHGTWPSGMSSLLVGEDLLVATHDSKVGVNVVGTTSSYFGSTLGGFLYRFDIRLTPRFESATMQRSRWHASPDAMVINVYHGSSNKFNSPPTFSSGYKTATYTIGTNEWADARSESGKWQAIYLVFSGTHIAALRSGAIEYVVDGAR